MVLHRSSLSTSAMETISPHPHPQDDMDTSTLYPHIPTDYTIKAGHLGLLAGGDLTIYDAYDSLAFRVQGGPHRVRILFDALHTPLIALVHHHGGWQGFKGNSLDCQDLIFTAQKTLNSAFNTELDVILSGGNQGDPSSSFRLKGSPFNKSCTIYKGDSVVAQANLLYKLRKIFYSRRKFRLTIFPGNDHTLIIAMLAIFLGS